MVERRVLFYGDSFVAGAGDPTALGWVGRVTAAAHAAGLAATPYNLGVRGETSVEVARRWEAEARPRLTAAAPARLVVSVGANDVLAADAGGAPRATAAASAAALSAILDGARARELPAFVVGPPPVGAPEADARLIALTGRFAELCAARDVPFVAVVEPLSAERTWLAEAAAGDGAHPGAGGYAALAELVLAGGFLAWLRR